MSCGEICRAYLFFYCDNLITFATMKTTYILSILMMATALNSCSYFHRANAIEHQLRKIQRTAEQVSSSAEESSQTELPNSETANNDPQLQQEASSQQDNGILVPKHRSDISELILTREAYIVSYNAQNKIPNWVAWKLTADHTTGPYKRGGIDFHEDTEAPSPRVTTYDYMRSGYDRGHMCPSGDNKWSRLAQEQSFLMTNICPQNHNLNMGDWNEMEQQCRRWARKYGSVYIVCGPVLVGKNHKRIGQHKVIVPEAFFKVVLCMEGTPKAIGFIYRNTEGNRPKGDYVNSIDQVERITGYDFFYQLPDDIEKRVEQEQNLNDW